MMRNIVQRPSPIKGTQGKSQKEGQDDQGTSKQLGASSQTLLLGPLAFLLALPKRTSYTLPQRPSTTTSPRTSPKLTSTLLPPMPPPSKVCVERFPQHLATTLPPAPPRKRHPNPQIFNTNSRSSALLQAHQQPTIPPNPKNAHTPPCLYIPPPYPLALPGLPADHTSLPSSVPSFLTAHERKSRPPTMLP